jgi:hypothetical protein
MQKHAAAIARDVQVNIHNWQPPAMANGHFQPPNVNVHVEQPHMKEFDRGYYGRHPHKEFGIGGMGMIMSLLMLFGGVMLWKRGGRVARVIGAILMAIVLLPLLMMVLSLIVPVVLLGILLYFMWRYIRKNNKREKIVYATAADTEYTAHTVDFLDEWELKKRRDMKNKEEN